MLLTAGLCLSLLYFWAYTGYVRGTVERYAGEEVPLTLTVTGYAEEGGVRCRIPVRVEGAGFLRDGPCSTGTTTSGTWSRGTGAGLFTAQDAASIHDTPITSFTAKGRYLMLFPDGELTAERPEAEPCHPAGADRPLAGRAGGGDLLSGERPLSQGAAPGG